MDNKKLLSGENFLLFVGIGYIAYWLLRKTPKAIDINPPMQSSANDPRTIVLDLRDKKKNTNRSGLFPSGLAKDYNTSESKTFAPSRTIINNYNDL